MSDYTSRNSHHGTAICPTPEELLSDPHLHRRLRAVAFRVYVILYTESRLKERNLKASEARKCLHAACGRYPKPAVDELIAESLLTIDRNGTYILSDRNGEKFGHQSDYTCASWGWTPSPELNHPNLTSPLASDDEREMSRNLFKGERAEIEKALNDKVSMEIKFLRVTSARLRDNNYWHDMHEAMLIGIEILRRQYRTGDYVIVPKRLVDRFQERLNSKVVEPSEDPDPFD